MACGCSKTRNKNRRTVTKKGKKTTARRSMPLITIRKRISAKKKKK